MRGARNVKAIAALAAGAAFVAIAGLVWVKYAPRTVPSGQPRLETLGADGLAGFREAFNSAEGDVRIIAMFSPT